jgi:hypothetical protein
MFNKNVQDSFGERVCGTNMVESVEFVATEWLRNGCNP